MVIISNNLEYIITITTPVSIIACNNNSVHFYNDSLHLINIRNFIMLLLCSLQVMTDLEAPLSRLLLRGDVCEPGRARVCKGRDLELAAALQTLLLKVKGV